MFSEGASCEAYAYLLARLGLDESYSSLLGGGCPKEAGGLAGDQ